ncbi:MAG: oligosaccharide flippase family protein [Geminicoccaceae bacterium]
MAIARSASRFLGPKSPTWVLGEAALSSVLSFVSLLGISRIIGPDAAGTAMVAIALFLLLDMITTALFADALVQYPNLSSRHANSAVTANGLIGLFLAAIMAILGPRLLAGHGVQETTPILLLLACMLPLSALTSAASGLLIRAQRFRLLSLRILVGQPLAVILGLILAHTGFGAWALIALQVTATSFGFVLMVCCSGLSLRSQLDGRALRDLWLVAGPQFVANLVEVGKYRLFTLALGMRLAESVLARSCVAFRILDAVLIPPWLITCRLALPRLCALQDDRRHLATAYGELAQLHALLGLPVAVGLTLVAPDLVQALLGPSWSGTAEAVQVAGLSEALFFMLGSYGSLFIAVGHARWNVYVATSSLIIQFALLAVLQPSTPQDIAMVWASPALILPPLITWAVLHELGRSLPWLIGQIAPALVATSAVAAAVLSIQHALALPPIAELLASILAGTVVFALASGLALGWRLPIALGWRDLPAPVAP